MYKAGKLGITFKFITWNNTSDNEHTYPESINVNLLTAKNNLITPESQLYQSEGVCATRCTGVCGPDGHSQAPMDGFMASRGTGGADSGCTAEL